ncbi:uncharacterized protein LOC127123454 [Lathyrus oleraceus]|uniref:uncharacterized protein LOC127123454 n=1 Tax=Pisum sativum TaxID=3888 RepID=UPI0021CE1A90|nr:uncharacterized protein LOC127123454 [Pisum sativum]
MTLKVENLWSSQGLTPHKFCSRFAHVDAEKRKKRKEKCLFEQLTTTRDIAPSHHHQWSLRLFGSNQEGNSNPNNSARVLSALRSKIWSFRDSTVRRFTSLLYRLKALKITLVSFAHDQKKKKNRRSIETHRIQIFNLDQRLRRIKHYIAEGGFQLRPQNGEACRVKLLWMQNEEEEQMPNEKEETVQNAEEGNRCRIKLHQSSP